MAEPFKFMVMLCVMIYGLFYKLLLLLIFGFVCLFFLKFDFPSNLVQISKFEGSRRHGSIPLEKSVIFGGRRLKLKKKYSFYYIFMFFIC